jgi:hypothetical protein
MRELTFDKSLVGAVGVLNGYASIDTGDEQLPAGDQRLMRVKLAPPYVVIALRDAEDPASQRAGAKLDPVIR